MVYMATEGQQQQVVTVEVSTIYSQRVSIEQLHDNTVSVEVHWYRHWIPLLMECLFHK